MDFKESCAKGTCLCKGYPHYNIKEALLKGKVTLGKCAMACHKRKFCFGFEYWNQDFTKDGPNCFECGTDPGMTQTVQVITGGKNANANQATVYVKRGMKPVGNVCKLMIYHLCL